MAGRATNLTLAVLLPLTVLSGLVAMAVGTSWSIRPAVVHGLFAAALLVTAPWKRVVIRRGWQRIRPGRWLSVALLTLTILAVASGFAQSAGATDAGPLTMMQVHVGSAVLALSAAVGHIRQRPQRIRSTDLERRSLLRAGALLAAAGALWMGWEGTLSATGWPGKNRRFTGSHEIASGRPSAMPATVWLNDRVPTDATIWSLAVNGTSVTRSAFESAQQTSIRATLDCTSGWFSTQEWRGVALADLIEPGPWRSVTIVSATGYRRRLPRRDAAVALLATHVGGVPLRAGHGAPVRLVVPGRRGFWWVKWVTAVDTSDRPWWIQLPFPAS